MALTIDHSTYGRVRDCVIRGFAKNFFSPKIRDYYGSGRVGPGAKIIKKNTKLDSKHTSNVPC